jgi:uncharacterized membrane protein YdjX (TVP38/TMEM64 family)
MEEMWRNILLELGIWAIPVSLLINTLVNLTGFLPSVFMTATNVWLWGAWWGGVLSWTAEVFGAMLAFVIYQRGMRILPKKYRNRWRWLESIQAQPLWRQWTLLAAARLVPWIPTGAVNLFAVWAGTRFFIFSSSTAVGKIPSVALETGAGYGFLQWIQLF